MFIIYFLFRPGLFVWFPSASGIRVLRSPLVSLSLLRLSTACGVFVFRVRLVSVWSLGSFFVRELLSRRDESPASSDGFIRLALLPLGLCLSSRGPCLRVAYAIRGGSPFAPGGSRQSGAGRGRVRRIAVRILLPCQCSR